MFEKYRGKHRPGEVRQVPYEEALSQHINAVDYTGKRYTTHLFANSGDWWYGATILTPSVVALLRQNDMLPLKEVVVSC